jgi:hypothetical protein
MSKKRLVYFTEIVTVLSEVGEKRLKDALSNKSDDDLDFYDRLGLKPPKDTEESIDENGMMTLKEGEYTYDFINRFFDVSDFFSAVEGDEIGTIIEFNNGKSFLVEEDIIEVYERIQYSQRNWFKKIIDFILEKFSNKKNIDLDI